MFLRPVGLSSEAWLIWVALGNPNRDDKRVDLSEFKKALPLLVRSAKRDLELVSLA